MSFLAPWMLAGLPLVAIPIIVHLVHQRRFQTMPWAAMQFLLRAQAMSRGYARLRQWLILAARTLAIAGLLLAIARPLASGLLGLAGSGSADVNFVLLDRSASMNQRGPDGQAKLEAGVDQVTEILETINARQTTVIDGASLRATQVDAPELLGQLPEAKPTSAATNVPAMVAKVHEILRQSASASGAVGRAEVWIVSDLRAGDWAPTSGRWSAIRDSFADLPNPVRFHVVAYPESAVQNRSIEVTEVRRERVEESDRLLVTFRITDRASAATRDAEIPVSIELDGTRTQIVVESTGEVTEVRDHPIALSTAQSSGWGRVSLAADANPADNDGYFAYEPPIERTTIIVARDAAPVRPLELAASIGGEDGDAASATVVSPGQFALADWAAASTVLWCEDLPAASDPARQILEQFVGRGGELIFFAPPSDAAANLGGAGAQPSIGGVTWGSWTDNDPGLVTSWVGDEDWLAKTRSGQPLPVGDLKVPRMRLIQGDFTTLATVDGQHPLLVRTAFAGGDVTFCTTTAAASDSTLASDGVVLYVLIQRAIESGARSLSTVRSWVAGQQTDGVAIGSDWQRVAGDDSVRSTDYRFVAGVYRDGQGLISLNRPVDEDALELVDDPQLAGLFGDLDFDRVDAALASPTSLVQEVWRLFLVAMAGLLLVEAALCLPPARNSDKPSQPVRARSAP